MATWKTGRGLSHFHEKMLTECVLEVIRSNLQSAFVIRSRDLENMDSLNPCSKLRSLVYLSAWIKCHMPAAFYCGLLNAQPMGFYTPSQLLQDAHRHSIEIRPICKHFGMALDPRRCGGIPMYSTGTSPHQGFQN